jgi:hypothetical protein
MAKDREIACRFYQYEGYCSKGRDSTFRKTCQTCNLYSPKKGGKPARIDNRRKKKEKIEKKEWY